MLVFLITPSPNGSFIAALIFAAAAFTDWLDGHLARANHQITTLGKLLDPIADKLLITGALIPLVGLNRVSPWIAAVLIGREFAVMGLRGIAATKGVIIAASNWGKYKMVCQVLALVFLILYSHYFFIVMGQTLLYLSLFLSLASGIDYFRSFRQKLDILVD
jgi:CDP-diacylglycerol--glycerol-3-phosphate 3-phosphatidyltransferase